MYATVEQSKENKGRAVANAVSQKQNSAESTFQIMDNRPAAIAQRKLQELVNNSPENKQATQLQAMAGNDFAKQQQPIQKKQNNTGLPDNLKAGIENLSGYSMDDVKVHRNSAKPVQLRAHAYAQGTEIHLGPGQEKHVPHEAWHVVQQKQGRVKPTVQMKGGVDANGDAGLEKEANVMGLKVSNSSVLDTTEGKASKNPKMVANRKYPPLLVKSFESNIVQRYIVLGTSVEDLETDVQEADQPLNLTGDVEGAFPSQSAGVDKSYNHIIKKPSTSAKSIKVADTLDMAIENVKEPKAFFVTPTILEQSNNILDNIHSAYRLIPQSINMTVARGDTKKDLRQVLPLNMVTDTRGLETTSLHRCNEMATRVMGIHYQKSTNSKLHDEEVTESAELILPLKTMVLNELFKVEEFVKAYSKLSVENKLILAKSTGINEFANPNVGEAFQILSLGEQTAEGGEWNFHWAGVVARSESDYVTMENYNRDTDEVTSGARGEDIDLRWFFQMYGTLNLQQTFHRRNNTGNFKTPMTMARNKPDEHTREHGQMLIDQFNGEPSGEAYRKMLGIKDERTRKETQEIARTTPVDISIIKILTSDMAVDNKIMHCLNAYQVPANKQELSLKKCLSSGLNAESTPVTFSQIFTDFCNGFSLSNYEYNEDKWNSWLAGK